MTTPKQTPFKIEMHHRYDLRSWIQKNFAFVEKYREHYTQEEISIIERRALEIIDACRQVEEIDLRADSAYIDYYHEDWEAIRDTYQKRDFRGLAERLSILVNAIDVE